MRAPALAKYAGRGIGRSGRTYARAPARLLPRARTMLNHAEKARRAISLRMTPIRTAIPSVSRNPISGSTRPTGPFDAMASPSAQGDVNIADRQVRHAEGRRQCATLARSRLEWASSARAESCPSEGTKAPLYVLYISRVFPHTRLRAPRPSFCHSRGAWRGTTYPTYGGYCAP